MRAGNRLTTASAADAVAAVPEPYVELLRHGSMVVEYYRPEAIDIQTPHSRDELYVIASGHGTFLNGGVERAFETGEVLFVPAGVEHRFTSFSGDFATWVVFYGPEGGERDD